MIKRRYVLKYWSEFVDLNKTFSSPKEAAIEAGSGILEEPLINRIASELSIKPEQVKRWIYQVRKKQKTLKIISCKVEFK